MSYRPLMGARIGGFWAGWVACMLWVVVSGTAWATSASAGLSVRVRLIDPTPVCTQSLQQEHDQVGLQLACSSVQQYWVRACKRGAATYDNATGCAGLFFGVGMMTQQLTPVLDRMDPHTFAMLASLQDAGDVMARHYEIMVVY